MKAFSVRFGLVYRLLTSLMLLPLWTIFLGSGSTYAQVTSDVTLNTTISQNGNNFTINNGTAAGNNLFHSFGQFSVPTGGSATFDLINTPVLNISNGATVFVQNLGLGNAGSLNINANTLRLDNGGSISASTKSGEGGNTNLQLRDLLLMRHGSFINAEAGGSGNGGNITINAPIIVGLENSDIIANAVQGRGGNIQIATQGIIGLKFRPQLTFENDITASSQFGVNGTVQINNIGVDPNSGLVQLPVNVTDPSQQITTGCAGGEGSRFVATGRGGVPQNPLQQVTSDVYDGLRLRTWDDLRDISAYRKSSEVTLQIPAPPEVLVQATSWRRNVQGKVELIADKSPTYLQQRLTCAALRKS